MDWTYFIVDGKFKIRKFPRPKQTVKIQDITEIESFFRTEMKHYGKTIEEAKEIYTDYYTDMCEVEVEIFHEYFDRNPKKFLEELNGLKGKYAFIEVLYYWADDTYWSAERSIEMWNILYKSSQKFSPDAKTLNMLEKLKLIERKSSSKKSDLIEYIESDAIVGELNNIADENNITVSGKKEDKIKQLIEALQKGLIKYTTIDVYRPGKNFQAWLNELQIKYIDEIEYALSTFDYPEFYIIEVWREAVLVNNEFPLIETTIKKRQQKYFELIAKAEERLENIPKQSTEEFEVGGINITITTTIDTDNEIEKKVLSSKKDTDIYYLNKIRKKKAEVQKEQVQKNLALFVIILIVLITVFYIL